VLTSRKAFERKESRGSEKKSLKMAKSLSKVLDLSKKKDTPGK